MAAYNAGKNATLWAAAALVGPNGTLDAKYARPWEDPPHGGNLVFADLQTDPAINSVTVTEVRLLLHSDGAAARQSLRHCAASFSLGPCQSFSLGPLEWFIPVRLCKHTRSHTQLAPAAPKIL